MPDVILPTLNEAAALPPLLAAMPAGYHPIVVDNGSDDGSADVARRAGATVVVETTRGFGAACWAGLVAARSEVVCFMDADGSLDPAHLVLVAAPVLAGAADLMLGARLLEPGSMPVHARVANRYLAGAIRRRTGVQLRDLGPMRAVRRLDLLELGMEDRRFGWPLEMVIKGAAAGWRIHDVGVPYRARTGRSKVTGTIRGTLRAVEDMSRYLR